MKLTALLVLSISGMLLSGCARPWELGYTPAYTAQERDRQIARNWDYEGKQVIDDWDHFWLLRPATTLTIWNVQ